MSQAPPHSVELPVPQPTATFDTEMLREKIREMGQLARDEDGERQLLILEAGCGRQWTLGDIDVDGIEAHITGVDLNEKSLRMRIDEMGDLHEAIVGDLRAVPLKNEHFHVVFCSWVLEHIDGAEKVLDRLVASLRPGGYLLVRIPDRDSVYGFLTRIAPFRAHVAYKRHVRGRANAGKPGFGPFPTVYDRVVSFRGMGDYCARRHLDVLAVYSSNFHLDHFGRYARVVDIGLRGIAALSFGRLTARHSNLTFVIRKSES